MQNQERQMSHQNSFLPQFQIPLVLDGLFCQLHLSFISRPSVHKGLNQILLILILYFFGYQHYFTAYPHSNIILIPIPWCFDTNTTNYWCRYHLHLVLVLIVCYKIIVWGGTKICACIYRHQNYLIQHSLLIDHCTIVLHNSQYLWSLISCDNTDKSAAFSLLLKAVIIIFTYWRSLLTLRGVK